MEDEKFGKLIPKNEAAKMLDISERTLQRLVAKKQIIFFYKKKFHGGKIAYFPISEIERIKLAWETKQPLPTIEIPSVVEIPVEPSSEPKAELPKVSKEKQTPKVEKDLTSKTELDDEKTLAKPFIKKDISVVEAAAKLILTVQEVSILTHIPVKELREDLNKGKLRGLFKGHGWKVKRTDLDDYVRSIYVPRRSDIIEDSGTNEIDLGDFGEFEPWEK